MSLLGIVSMGIRVSSRLFPFGIMFFLIVYRIHSLFIARDKNVAFSLENFDTFFRIV